MTSHTDTAEFMDELRSALAEDNGRHVDNHTPATSGDVRSAIASGDGASLARYLVGLGNDALMTDDASAYLYAYLCHPANAAWAARTVAPHLHLSTWGVPHHDPTISHAWRHPLRVSLGDVDLATFTVKANAWRRYSGLVPHGHRVYFAAGRHKLTSPTPIVDLVRLVPGCVEVRGDLQCATVYTEGGEVRLVRRAGSYRAAMSWRAM